MPESHHPPSDPYGIIRDLPLWRGKIEIVPLSGGITNHNFLVSDGGRRVVVRRGGEIPVHQIMRFNEHAASKAAAAAGISPPVIYASPGVLVIDYIESTTLDSPGVRHDRVRCLELVKRAHRDIPGWLRGPVLSFNVFHILRDYHHTLIAGQSRMTQQLGDLAQRAATLESLVGPVDLVFGHNDLLPGNFLDDGTRLWLVDWDYAGFNTPLFDLGGMSSNNGFDDADDRTMLEAYFETPVTDGLFVRYHAMRCASLLREAVWSMVSELHSTLNFDYVAYTTENMARFERAWTRLQELSGS